MENMSFEFMKKKMVYNEYLREKYNRLVAKEKEMVGGHGRRLTQNKLGARMGISDSYISFWLKKQREFDFEILERVAAVLLEEEALLGGIE